VKKLAAETSALARDEAAGQPADGLTKAEWDAHVQRAKDIDAYTEYALMATAIASEPATTIDLLATLEKQNPKSKYLDEVYPVYFAALTKTGAGAQIVPTAEKALASLPANPDLLALLGDTAWKNKQYAKASALGLRLAAATAKHAKPESVSAADWEKKKTLLTAHGYWWAGMAAAMRNDFYNTEKNLKVAVPLLAGNEDMLAPALYQLAFAEYNLGKMTLNKAQMLQGANHYDQVAKMKSPLATQAWTNAHMVRDEAQRMR